jgi:hypothetical protein
MPSGKKQEKGEPSRDEVTAAMVCINHGRIEKRRSNRDRIRGIAGVVSDPLVCRAGIHADPPG